MKPELRVALLGQGFMGKAHSNAYCQAEHFYDLPYRVSRKLLCGRDTTALAAMAERWGWEETATDWRAVVERPDIDAIDVALPNHLHAPAAIAAAEAGKIVLCEKPLAMNLDEAMAMVEAAKNVPNMVWYNYRRVPAIAFASELINQGRLGEIFHYRAAYMQQWGPDTSRAKTWRMDPAQAGSGVADDLLAHSIDTAMYLNGPIRETAAAARTFVPNRAIDDAVSVLANFQNGSLGSFEATRFGIGYRNSNRFEIHGAGGMLRFDLERLNELEFYDANQPGNEQGLRDIMVTQLAHPIFGNFWRPGHIIGYEHTFIATLAEFLGCVSRGQEFHADFRDGLNVQQVLGAVQESASSHKWTAVRNA
ncbi:MAG TPA: Gfo/Idh/MocA family oxidoreductase [Bryobacteraceae bacterium]|jgi:predicted dehydrogenase|nr:Gfo/Idh/MocA family oxidoreductase [Bryobacteraceae bacterium]